MQRKGRKAVLITRTQGRMNFWRGTAKQRNPSCPIQETSHPLVLKGWQVQTIIQLAIKLTNKVIGISKHLSIITLNVSDLNLPVKELGLSDWKLDTTFCCLQEKYFTGKGTHTEGQKNRKIIYKQTETEKKLAYLFWYMIK